MQSTRQVGESKHGRINAMAAANAGFDAYRAAQSVGQAANGVGKFMSNTGNVDSVIGAQITYGKQKSESRTHSRTYGGRNTSSQTLKDSKDLCGAQCLDLEQNKNNLLNYGFDEDDINQAIENATVQTQLFSIKDKLFQLAI